MAGSGTSTTADGLFAECLGHSAKPLLHSAKALPSATLGKEQTAKLHPAKGSLPSAVCRALGKENWPSGVVGVFAECRVRKALGKAFPFFFEKSFAECLPDPALGKEKNIFFEKSFAECLAETTLGKAGKHMVVYTALPSARVLALGKETW